MPVQQRDEGLRQCTHADKVPIVSEESINPATAGNAGSYGSPIVTVGTLYITALTKWNMPTCNGNVRRTQPSPYRLQPPQFLGFPC